MERPWVLLPQRCASEASTLNKSYAGFVGESLKEIGGLHVTKGGYRSGRLPDTKFSFNSFLADSWQLVLTCMNMSNSLSTW